jgi:DNA-binding CsgD family transcriptional regulator
MLTNEQFKILKLLCDGYSQREVSEKMTIAISNVKIKISMAKKVTGSLSTFSLIHKLSTDKTLSNSFDRYLYDNTLNINFNKNKGKYINSNYA